MKVYVLTEDVEHHRHGYTTFVRGVYTDRIKALQESMYLRGYTDVIEKELNTEGSE